MEFRLYKVVSVFAYCQLREFLNEILLFVLSITTYERNANEFLSELINYLKNFVTMILLNEE